MHAYLDYNATTPVDSTVLDAMLPYLREDFGNAGSVHAAGQRARGAVDRARESVAALLGAKTAEIVFTSGGTESDNLALFGIVAVSQFAEKAQVEASGAKAHEGVEGLTAGMNPRPSRIERFSANCSTKPRKHVIATAIEHHAVLNSCQALEKRGVEVTYVRVGSDGIVDPENIRRALRPETVLISVMHANNELGTVQPIEEIGRIAAEADVCFHCDAVQSAGKLPIDVNLLGVDLLSISAHKFYGPKGVGALYVRSGTSIEPQFHGGHHERDRRPGTENVPGIVGLRRAAELARERLAGDSRRISALRDRLEATLLSAIPGIRVNGNRAHRTPNTANVTFPGASGEALLIALDLQGVACSTGAACASGAIEPSHVLTAIGLSPEDARSTLRFSLGRPTTIEEIDYAIGIIPAVVERLRALSPASAATASGAHQR